VLRDVDPVWTAIQGKRHHAHRDEVLAAQRIEFQSVWIVGANGTFSECAVQFFPML